MQERRQYVRIKTKLYVGYKSLDLPEVEGHCWSRDISLGGIGLLLKHKVDFGNIMELRIGLHDKIKPVVIKAKVFWQIESPETKQLQEKTYRTGLIFIGLTEEDKNRLENFINQYLKKSGNPR